MIMRPSRFGKTLNISMLECFFFRSLCGAWGFISGAVHLAGGTLSADAGDISRNQSVFCCGKEWKL